MIRQRRHLDPKLVKTDEPLLQDVPGDVGQAEDLEPEHRAHGAFWHAPPRAPARLDNVAHAFRIDSTEARLLLFFGPAGVDRFFREGGKPARSLGLPPADEQFLDREALKAVGNREAQEFVGPPLPPKD